MRACTYSRVSTDDQVKGYSLPSQLEAMRKYAQEHGFEVVREFSDEGVSGAKLNRPALDELRECVRNKMFDAVIVYDPDRLSRKLVHLMILTEEIEKHGVQLHFVTQSMGQGPEEKMLFGMKGVFAEYERTKIIERTVRGRLRKAKQDGKQPGGRPMFGYKLVNGKHEIDEDKAKIVRFIFDLLVKDGLTLYSCQKRLNKLGIPSPYGGEFWNRATLYRMITNPAYVGNWCYNRRNEAEGENSLRDKNQWVHIPIPALIPKEVFEKIQIQLERNKAVSVRYVQKEHLLTGLLVCGKCGRGYRARTNGRYAYYECRTFRGNVLPEPCPSCSVRIDKIELVVWDSVAQLLSQPKLIIEQVKRDGNKPLELLEANLNRVSKNLANKTLEADRMLEAYKVGAIDLGKLKDQMDEIKIQQLRLDKEKEALEAELQKAKAQELNEDRLNDFCRNLPNVLDSLDYNQRRQILKEVVDKIEFPAKRRKTFKLAGKIRRRTKLAGRIKPKIAKMSFYGPF